MAEGGSFFSQQVGEPQRRAFLELDRRLGEVQATIDALSPAHGDLTGLGDDDHTQYHTDARGDARYLQLSGGSLSGDLQFSAGSVEIAGGYLGVGRGNAGTYRVDIGNESSNGNILRLKGADDTLNFTVSAGDWSILNSQQSNGIVIYDGTGGVEVFYNGASYMDFDSDGIIARAQLKPEADGTINLGGNAYRWATTYTDTINLNSLTLSNVDSSGSMRIQGSDGYIDLGPKNGSWAHIYTDRAGFYMNKKLDMAGSSRARGNFEATGNLVITRPDALMLNGASDNNHKIYSLNNANTALPWSDGPVMVGYTGWGMYCEEENTWRMGLRGNTGNTQRYGWYNCNLMVGTAPDDAINTHTLRVQGDQYLTGVVTANEFRAHDNGPASDPSFCFSGDEDTGMYRYQSNSIGFATGGGFRARIESNGIHLASGDWFRSYGSTGWYNGSHGGGMYMIDSTWVRTYNNKRIYTGSGQIRSDAGNGFNGPNLTTTWSYNTLRWNSSNGDFMPYASLTEMKDDIVEINGVLGYLNERSLIYDLKPKIFREANNRVDAEGNPVYTTRGEYGHGMLAEEVLEVAPELAYYDHNGELLSYGNDALIPDIIAELQRLMPMIEELYGAAHPDWVPPSPRPPERAQEERDRYETARQQQAINGIEDPTDPLNGQHHLDDEEE